MTNSPPGFPRLHVERLPESLPPLFGEDSNLDQFCRAFVETTGCNLSYEPRAQTAAQGFWSRSIGGPSRHTSGRLVLSAAADSSAARGLPGETAAAERLADAFGSVLLELEQTRHALWQREAELAAGVPVSIRVDSERHLAQRLEAVLRGGAEAANCQAAALYLLDEGTSELKLRASFNLPRERLLEPARPLRGALADLEALVGHAVVLEDVAVLPHWKVPENFPSAVCVPVSSDTTPLGTLWFFSTAQRDFSPTETNLIEIVAGRIASDLEREMLLQSGCDSREVTRQIETAADWQRRRLPHAPPLLDGWQLAGWSSRGDELAAGFHDWFLMAEGTPAVTAGSVVGEGVTAALSAAALHAIAKAHGMHAQNVRDWLVRIEEQFTAASPGDERASLFAALLDPHSGRLEYAAAGNLAGWLVTSEGCRPIAAIAAELGIEQELPIRSISEQMMADDALVVICRDPGDERCLSLPTNLICESLADRRNQPAAVLLDAVRAALASQPRKSDAETSVLVIKRRP